MHDDVMRTGEPSDWWAEAETEILKMHDDIHDDIHDGIHAYTMHNTAQAVKYHL